MAQDLSVRLLSDHKHSDAEIAAAIQTALKWNVMVPKTITAKVTSGSVTLEGQATWNFERDAAERAVSYLTGVVSVINAVGLNSQVSPTDVKEKIEAALNRRAKADAKGIKIDTSAGKVTLTGHASSWHSTEDAADAAWATPGVTEVVDRMTVSY